MRRATHTRWMILAVLSLAPSASAEPTDAERAIAESLFQQGKMLSKKGDFAAACPKFAESFRIDAAGGTALNLADCLEHEGKLASAYGMFQKARVMALGANRQDRVQIADEHLAALAPRLPHVVLAVPPAARVAGLEVLLDGVSLGPASWGTPLMVDPGEHAVLARALARSEWKGAVTIHGDGTEQTVSIPVLEPVPAAAAVNSIAAPSPMASAESAGPPPRDREGLGTARTVGVVVAGAGVASLAVGAYFWSHMRSLESEADGLAAANDSAAFQRADDARTAQKWARITIGAGAVAVGAGAVLYLTAPKRGEATALRVTPTVASTWGLSLQGAW